MIPPGLLLRVTTMEGYLISDGQPLAEHDRFTGERNERTMAYAEALDAAGNNFIL